MTLIQYKTALKFDITGYKLMGRSPKVQEKKIRKQDYNRLTRLQRLFIRGYTILDRDEGARHGFPGQKVVNVEQPIL
jgi:hypothetical protein